VPREGDFYLCGPTTFLNDLRTGLTAWGVAPSRIHSEIFSGGPSLMPGGGRRAGAPAHHQRGLLEQDRWCPSPAVVSPFAGARRRTRACLELAEACDVPVRWSCRTGVCHNCESGLIPGASPTSPTRSTSTGRGKRPHPAAPGHEETWCSTSEWGLSHDRQDRPERGGAGWIHVC